MEKLKEGLPEWDTITKIKFYFSCKDTHTHNTFSNTPTRYISVVHIVTRMVKVSELKTLIDTIYSPRFLIKMPNKTTLQKTMNNSLTKCQAKTNLITRALRNTV